MNGSRGTGRIKREVCRCLPDVLPDEVRRSLEELTDAVSSYKAMADGLRLQILHMLAISPLCVCVIRAVTGVEDSRLSYHLSIMKAAGLIDAEKRGSWIIYNISETGEGLLSTCRVHGP